jgi:hypothetical protein
MARRARARRHAPGARLWPGRFAISSQRRGRTAALIVKHIAENTSQKWSPYGSCSVPWRGLASGAPEGIRTIGFTSNRQRRDRAGSTPESLKVRICFSGLDPIADVRSGVRRAAPEWSADPTRAFLFVAALIWLQPASPPNWCANRAALRSAGTSPLGRRRPLNPRAGGPERRPEGLRRRSVTFTRRWVRVKTSQCNRIWNDLS